MSSPSQPDLKDVRRALALPNFDVASARARMIPRQRDMRRPPHLEGQAKLAAVLILLYPTEQGLAFPLTRRTELVASHKGQISLPGGAQEPGEDSLVKVAMREVCEEIGVCRQDIEVIGQLGPLYVPASDFEIHPFVGCLPSRPRFRPDPVEVAEILEMPLPLLLDDSIKALEHWSYPDFDMDVPFYRLQGQVIWGATAIILSEFEERLRQAMSQPKR
jgi:8-oxo-dGTP pyrophosphatase MutT (NUDIX family)